MSSNNLVTESDSLYQDLDKKSIEELTVLMNNEDKKVAYSVENSLPQINKLIDEVVNAFKNNGRLFYIGAGTSGRLGVLDSSECPPTFGVSSEMVYGVIAGGDQAIRFSVENAEDHKIQAWNDLCAQNITSKDMVIGLSASGTTPYVLSGLKKCRENNIKTGSIVCNPNSIISSEADFPIEVVVGPEFVTGSTRLKSGTAQKLVINMISTISMIKLEKVKGNKMVHMQIKNKKLELRGANMLVQEFGIELDRAINLLNEHKSVFAVSRFLHKNKK